MSYKNILKKILPKTLFGQVLITMVINLLIFINLGFMFVIDDHKRVNAHLLNEYSAQRVAGIVSVLNDATPAERSTLAKKLSVLPTTISLTTAWQPSPAAFSESDSALVENIIKHLTAPLKLQVLQIDSLPKKIFDALEFENDPKFPLFHIKHKANLYPREIFVQVKLTDGSTITVHHFLPDNIQELSVRFYIFGFLLTLAVISLTSWSLYKLTKPLKSLTDAATNLSSDLNSAPLSETGPDDIVRASKAFNLMQKSLKNHLETRTQALYAVSHDIRLPLTRLKLRIENNVADDLKEQIDQDIEEMESMIGQTLTYLKVGQDAEPFIKLNIGSLLDTICDNMEDLGAYIERDYEICSPIVAQPHALNRCLSNLFENARRYGGDLIRVTLQDLITHVRISIEDNGPGIPEEDLSKVFEPYYRVDNSRAKHTGGTGLGLPIAKKIIELHYGKIFLGSSDNKGLKVTIILPKDCKTADSNTLNIT